LNAIVPLMSTPPHRWRVLIVEDDPLIGMLLSDMLQELGCEPEGPVGNVAAALKLLASKPFDGATVDCNLGNEISWPLAEALVARNLPFSVLHGLR
jgi:DNA-binding response OmpR family regulator